jgi:hypothetical protein
MLTRLRQLPAPAYWSLGITLLGGLCELPLHFGQASWVGWYAAWLASLPPIDRDFFYTTYELATHILIGLGLTGMVVTALYQYVRESDQQTTASR